METRETDILNIFDFPIYHFPDRSARWLLQDKENVRGLIEIVAERIAADIDFNRLTQHNRSLISDTLREQESDLIFSVPFHSGLEADELIIYILIEHQSTVDQTMGFRVLFYMTQIWDAQRRKWESDKVPKSERRLRPILPIVFYTGSQRWRSPLSLSSMMEIPAALSQFVPTFETLFLSVKETDISVLTRSEHPFGWLLTVLQQEHSDTEAIRDALERAMMHLSELEPEDSEQLRRAIGYLVLLILHQRQPEEHTGLLDILNEYTDEMEVVKMAEVMSGTISEQAFEQGETRAKRDAVLKLLQFRFVSVPESLRARINRIESGAVLDALFDEILTAATPDDINLQNGGT